MRRIHDLGPLGLLLLCILTLDAHAEHAVYSGPWSRTAIELEARRALIQDGGEHDAFARLSEASTAPSTADGIALSGDPSRPTSSAPEPSRPDTLQRSSTWKTVGWPLTRLVVTTELSSFLLIYAVTRQHTGGYYFGGYMFALGAVAPMLLKDNEVIANLHTATVLSFSAAALYVGARTISREKHPPVDRTRMFHEGFIGLNIAVAVPVLVEYSLRMIERKR